MLIGAKSCQYFLGLLINVSRSLGQLVISFWQSCFNILEAMTKLAIKSGAYGSFVGARIVVMVVDSRWYLVGAVAHLKNSFWQHHAIISGNACKYIFGNYFDSDRAKPISLENVIRVTVLRPFQFGKQKWPTQEKDCPAADSDWSPFCLDNLSYLAIFCLRVNIANSLCISQYLVLCMSQWLLVSARRTLNDL